MSQEFGRHGVVDRSDRQLGKADALRRIQRVSRGQDDRQRAAGPAGDVLDALTGGRIDPLDVVDHRQDRALPSCGPQQAQRGDADRQPVTGRRRLERERAHEHRRLRYR